MNNDNDNSLDYNEYRETPTDKLKQSMWGVPRSLIWSPRHVTHTYLLRTPKMSKRSRRRDSRVFYGALRLNNTMDLRRGQERFVTSRSRMRDCSKSQHIRLAQYTSNRQ